MRGSPRSVRKRVALERKADRDDRFGKVWEIPQLDGERVTQPGRFRADMCAKPLFGEHVMGRYEGKAAILGRYEVRPLVERCRVSKQAFIAHEMVIA